MSNFGAGNAVHDLFIRFDCVYQDERADRFVAVCHVNLRERTLVSKRMRHRFIQEYVTRRIEKVERSCCLDTLVSCTTKIYVITWTRYDMACSTCHQLRIGTLVLVIYHAVCMKSIVVRRNFKATDMVTKAIS